MELPSWLKIESLIRKLDFTGWFREWFKHEKKINIENINIEKIIVLPINSDENPEKIKVGELLQKNETKEQGKIELTYEERYLIMKVNKVHVLCGYQGFDFESNYRHFLNHIRKKPSEDWYECAAKDIVLAKESIDFFSAFKELKKPEKKESFEKIKEDINWLYKVIQRIKHSNKRNDPREDFLTGYDARFNKTDERYEGIFNQFQKSLIKLFENFKLKNE